MVLLDLHPSLLPLICYCSLQALVTFPGIFVTRDQCSITGIFCYSCQAVPHNVCNVGIQDLRLTVSHRAEKALDSGFIKTLYEMSTTLQTQI